MKRLHLLCNAHLDPVWLWRKNEGIAEAISTFRVAADFCENYDCFIFNHNEALLYEWIEEHEPELFKRIKELVEIGKWKIMGGWYLQPDCVMTSGESLLSQIRLGNDYFAEKFGVKPTTSINFDSFGHSRGLVQILNKTGYDSYIFSRPNHLQGDFIWEGFDGSTVLIHGIYEGYNSMKERATEKINSCIDNIKNDTYLCLWGIGNHGGGPSKTDLEAINRLIDTSNVEILHSSAENYISEINRNGLDVVKSSLGPSMVGCYTSMVRIKQANRRLENKIALTEKIMTYADVNTDFEFDAEELMKSKKALAFCQFHDILPGSAIKAAEEDSLRTLSYGEEIADTLYAKAFFKLCEGQKKAVDGEIPIMVFNPHPYEIEGEFEIGFMLQYIDRYPGMLTYAEVFDSSGNALPTQNEKPDATFNLDWIEKISFRGKLAPSTVTRFDCRLTHKEAENVWPPCMYQDDITRTNERMTVKINGKTGLIDLYEIDKKKYIENSGKIEVYKDNEDPWGMKVNSFKDYEGTFELMSDEEANTYIGYPNEKTSNVRIVEDGCVRTKVQALFKYNRSVAAVEYTLPKNDTYIDVNIKIYSNEPNKMIKYRLDTKLRGTPYGETAFGHEKLSDNEDESVFHKWCGIKEADNALYVINNGTYGGSFSNSSIKMSLLRTPIYSAHPIADRQIAPHDRLLEHIDMGEREFSFRITTDADVSRQAQIFNETPYLLSFFPSGIETSIKTTVEIDNPDIILSSARKKEETYELTLYNASDNNSTTQIRFANHNLKLDFSKHELKIINI